MIINVQKADNTSLFVFFFLKGAKIYVAICNLKV